MDGIKVSVLVYVKNDAMHIEKCVHSVMNQTLRDIEILLIDGGSTDGTLEKVKALASEDDRIKLMNADIGVGRQFNVGLVACAGEYIGICESDDYILPDMYEKQYAVAKQYGLDVLKANVSRFCEANGQEYHFPFALSADWPLYERVIEPQKDLKFLRLGVNGFWSGLYRREFLMENGIYMNETSGAAYQDITFSFLTEAYAKRAYVMKDTFYCYRMDNPNSSINNPHKMTILRDEYRLLKERLKEGQVWERYKEYYLSWKLSGHLWMYDNLADEIKNEYLELLYQDVRDEILSEEFSLNQLSQAEHTLYKNVETSCMNVSEYFENKTEVRRVNMERLKQINLKRDIIIFGAGNLGRLVYRYLKTKGKTAVAYIDNDTSKQNQQVDSIPTLSPEDAVRIYKEGLYIIANSAYSHQIMEQLKAYGVTGSDIIVCNDYDVFLKQALIKEIKDM